MNKNSKVIALVGVFVFSAWLFMSSNGWTLMVCKEKLNDAECYSNSYVIDGFDTQKECMLEGAAKFSKEGFECGKNCKEDGGLRICKEICNAAGCRN